MIEQCEDIKLIRYQHSAIKSGLNTQFKLEYTIVFSGYTTRICTYVYNETMLFTLQSANMRWLLLIV